MTDADTATENAKNGHLSRLSDLAVLSSREFNPSRRPRLKILDAVVSVLACIGYKEQPTTGVAKEAGIVRAAMLYNFGACADLIEAIVRHVTRRGINLFLEAMKALPHDADFLKRAMDIVSAQLKAPEFLAKSASKPC